MLGPDCPMAVAIARRAAIVEADMPFAAPASAAAATMSATRTVVAASDA